MFYLFECVRVLNRSIRLDLKQQVSEVQHKYPALVPGLAIVQVGGRDDSNVYIRMKIRAAAEIGITAQHVQLPHTVTQSELLAKVIYKNKMYAAHVSACQDWISCR